MIKIEEFVKENQDAILLGIFGTPFVIILWSFALFVAYNIFWGG